MDGTQLIEKIKEYNGPLPKPRFVIDVYAEVVAKLSPKLTPEEMEDLVALGALVRRRSTQLVPVLHWDDIPQVLGPGRAVV